MLLHLAVVLSIFTPPPHHLATTVNCRPENAWSRTQVTYFTRIVTGSSPDKTTLRQAYFLPGVIAEPAVQQIFDEAECARAVAALSTIYTDGVNRAPVFVFKIGTTRFAVADGSLFIHIFDTSYNYLVTLGSMQ